MGAGAGPGVRSAAAVVRRPPRACPAEAGGASVGAVEAGRGVRRSDGRRRCDRCDGWRCRRRGRRGLRVAARSVAATLKHDDGQHRDCCRTASVSASFMGRPPSPPEWGPKHIAPARLPVRLGLRTSRRASRRSAGYDVPPCTSCLRAPSPHAANACSPAARAGALASFFASSLTPFTASCAAEPPAMIVSRAPWVARGRPTRCGSKSASSDRSTCRSRMPGLVPQHIRPATAVCQAWYAAIFAIAHSGDASTVAYGGHGGGGRGGLERRSVGGRDRRACVRHPDGGLDGGNAVLELVEAPTRAAPPHCAAHREGRTERRRWRKPRRSTPVGA